MKVIHFLSSIDKASGGVTAYIELLSRELKHKVDLVIATGVSIEPIKIQGVKVEFFDLSLKKIKSLSQSFNKFLIEEKPDIVHVNGIWEPCCWLFQKEAQKIGIKVVLSPHGMLEPYILNRNPWKKKIAMFLYQDKAIKKADYIHATAISECMNINELGYTNNNIIIPNGVDTSEVLIKDSFSKTKRSFLFLSRIHPKKGIEFLLEAVEQIKNEDFEVIIAGTGDEKYTKNLKEIAKSKKIENKVKFVGPVYGKAKWELYKKVDYFILPTYSENFGIVVAEALATGLPVITTKGTPWEELIKNNCGWWIDLSIENLKKTIRAALSLSTDELLKMGLNGKKLVSSKYEIGSVTNLMYEFYKRIS